MARPRHPKKELEDLLQKVEAQNWRVTKGNRYFGCWCPCPKKHKTWVHLTPSNPNYARDKLAWFKRQPCWKETT